MEHNATLSVRHEVAPDYAGRPHGVIAFYVDGRDLRELVWECEKPFADAEAGATPWPPGYTPRPRPATGGYHWFTEDILRRWMAWPLASGGCLWLGTGDSGEPGEWPLEAQAVTTALEWRLGLFHQSHRPYWTHEALGTLVFDRGQAEAVFAEAGLPFPEPSETERVRWTLPKLANHESAELAAWGFQAPRDGQAHLGIRDLVNSSLDLKHGDEVAGVSPLALDFADAIGHSTGTTERQRLKQFVAPLLASSADERAEAQRRELIQRWYRGTFIPTFLRLVQIEPATSTAEWIVLRNGLREQRARLPPALPAPSSPYVRKTPEERAAERTRLRPGLAWQHIGRMPSSIGWDARPGLELLYLPSGLARAAGFDGEETRVIWSACWYATLLAACAVNESAFAATFDAPMRRLLDTAFDLLATLLH